MTSRNTLAACLLLLAVGACGSGQKSVTFRDRAGRTCTQTCHFTDNPFRDDEIEPGDCTVTCDQVSAVCAPGQVVGWMAGASDCATCNGVEEPTTCSEVVCSDSSSCPFAYGVTAVFICHPENGGSCEWEN